LFQNPGQHSAANEISFSQLLTEVDNGRVRDVVIQGPDITGSYTDGRSFQTYAPNDPGLVQKLYNKGVSITARPQQDSAPWFVALLLNWLPFLALIGVWIFLSRQMQGAGGRAMGFGKSKAKLLTEAHGIPIGLAVAGANRHDMKLVEATLASIPIARPRPTPEHLQHLCLDKGYDYTAVRETVAVYGYTAHIRTRAEEASAKREIPGYRTRRWPVERTHSWMNRFRRLLIRWDKRTDNYLAFLHFACAWIAFRAAGVVSPFAPNIRRQRSLPVAG